MKLTDRVSLLPTQYRRVSQTKPLHRGHYTPLVGTWNFEDGFTQGEVLSYDTDALACPIIAIVEGKFGKEAVTLTITGKVAQLKTTRETTQGEHTLKRKIYEPTSTTKNATLIIPPYTRPWATFVITGLGKDIYEIVSVTADKSWGTGEVKFYALASRGSKIIYWLAIHQLTELSREILRPWVAPTVCERCAGTGIDPDTGTCKQCLGYKYDGYNSVKYIQRKIGADVGLARNYISDWNNMSDSEKEAVKKFINKCWTQKWWVTPTVKEIKRLFSHFYMIDEDDIYLTERFNMQEPVWSIFLPHTPTTNGPFGQFTEEDRDLMKYIAESITPAGVSVFMGFYDEFGSFGDLEDFYGCENFSYLTFHSGAFEHEYVLWGCPRWDFYNGWNNANHHFETGASGMIAPWTTNGLVDIINVNDQARHVARLRGNAYMEIALGLNEGTIELWSHPHDCLIRYGIRDALGWVAYIEHNVNAFYNNNGKILRYASRDSDYHLRFYFNGNSGAIGRCRTRILLENPKNFNYIKSGSGQYFRIQTYGTGAGYVDCVAIDGSGAYQTGDNWARLHPCGFGILNEDVGRDAGGNIKVTNLLERYFRRDRFFDVS